MKRTDTGPFSMVPEWVLDAEVSDRAVRLYAAMRRYADKGGTCWPSRRTIAERLHCSTDSVDRAMAELVTLGAIQVIPRKDDEGRQHSNYYTVFGVRRALGKVAEGEVGKVAAQNENHLELDKPLSETSSQEGKARKPRPPDPIWDALVEVFPAQPQTKAERSKWNAAAGQLREVGATPSQIRARAGAWKSIYPNAKLTPFALVNHWSALGPADVVPGPQLATYTPEPEPDFKTNAASVRALRQGLRSG